MFARVIDGVAIVAHARAAIFAVGALVWSGVVADDAATRAHELTLWAAYYFKVSNANPLTQYEDLYGTGERAFTGASQMLRRAAIERVMGAATAEMGRPSGATA